MSGIHHFIVFRNLLDHQSTDQRRTHGTISRNHKKNVYSIGDDPERNQEKNESGNSFFQSQETHQVMRFPTKNAVTAILRERTFVNEIAGEGQIYRISQISDLIMHYEFEPGKGVETPVAKKEKTSIDIVKIQMVKDGSIEYGKKPISGPQELAELGLKFLKNADREMFILVCLNTKNFVNCIHLVSIGTLDQAVISGREVMKTALLANAAKIAFIHNHCSGDVEPSPEDVSLTRRLASCADLFDIRVLDHVIVADDGHYEGFAEKKLLKPDSSPIDKRAAWPMTG
jgi:DNA repair protein RadC